MKFRTTKTTWTTSEGTRLKIADMERSHISNVLGLLKRHAFALKLSAIRDKPKQRAAILKMTDEAFLLQHVPAYNALLTEALTRRIGVYQ